MMKKKLRVQDESDERCMDRVRKTFLALSMGVAITTVATSYFFRNGVCVCVCV